MSNYNQKMISAIKNLSTQKWGQFFLAMPVYIDAAGVTASDIQVANSARVFIPDSAISRSQPVYGEEAWHVFGTLGCAQYMGALIPLSIVKELNPNFDYISILRSCARRPEYEEMVVQHIARIKQVIQENVG